MSQQKNMIRIQEEPFNFAAEVDLFSKNAAVLGAGAVVTFAGIMRDDGASLSRMIIEHYPAMSEKAISGFINQAVTRWRLSDALVIHRYGELTPQEQIMMVATAARHRIDAFQAAEFLMDYLKSRAPFWKKEVDIAGNASWVASKEHDEKSLNRWAEE